MKRTFMERQGTRKVSREKYLQKCASLGVGEKLGNFMYNVLQNSGRVPSKAEEMQKRAEDGAFALGLEDGKKWAESQRGKEFLENYFG